jgi:hypothetical protein
VDHEAGGQREYLKLINTWRNTTTLNQQSVCHQQKALIVLASPKSPPFGLQACVNLSVDGACRAVNDRATALCQVAGSSWLAFPLPLHQPIAMLSVAKRLSLSILDLSSLQSIMKKLSLIIRCYFIFPV